MRKIEGGYTAKQFVTMKLIDYLHGMHTLLARGDNHLDVSLSDTQRRDVVAAAAKEHNRLLDKSGFDGLHI